MSSTSEESAITTAPTDTPPADARPADMSPARRAGKEKEAVLTGAADLAREAAVTVAGEGEVGEHLGVTVEGERTLTHHFASSNPGYRGWTWSVTLARPPRGRRATVSEVHLLPGTGALLAPRWVPWSKRLRPDDVGPTDTLPYTEHDDRLVQQYEATGDDADALGTDLVHELGLGRPRVLSAQGRREAATRWYAGEAGPESRSTKAAGASCSSCGFFLALSGSLRTAFGVCANEWSPSDGKVVAMNHGCGAHSETGEELTGGDWRPAPPVVDEFDLEVVTVGETSAG